MTRLDAAWAVALALAVLLCLLALPLLPLAIIMGAASD